MIKKKNGLFVCLLKKNKESETIKTYHFDNNNFLLRVLLCRNSFFQKA